MKHHNIPLGRNSAARRAATGNTPNTKARAGASHLSSSRTLQRGLDETRRRFAATFRAQCDAIGSLVDNAAAFERPGPVGGLQQIIHRLGGLAGTIGFPRISARASELQALVGAGSRALDPVLARAAVEAIRDAFAEDLAASPPPVGLAARAGKSVVANDASNLAALAAIGDARAAPPLRVLIVDDHAMVRRGLRALLSDEFGGAIVGEACDAREAVGQLRKTTWDIALLDVTMPGKNGLELLKELKTEWPALPVLVLSGHTESQYAVRVLQAGAGGYVTKETAPHELAEAIRKVLSGGRYVSLALGEQLALGVTGDLTRAPHEGLSDREYDVMSRIGCGRTVTEIAEELSLSAKTISTYRARILEKLGARNSAEIVQYAIRNGLVT
ncbi:MAG: Response regulator, LuxR family [Acidobacteria bacterium]|nr:Response regulator, LuxR family [Acidobacteriota bacterium]